MRSLVHKACGQILATGKVQLFKSHRPDYKDGEQMRDFLYVKDAIRMTLHLAEAPSAGGLFNLGSGKAHTWVELATAIFTALGKEPNIEFINMPEHLQWRPILHLRRHRQTPRLRLHARNHRAHRSRA